MILGSRSPSTRVLSGGSVIPCVGAAPDFTTIDAAADGPNLSSGLYVRIATPQQTMLRNFKTIKSPNQLSIRLYRLYSRQRPVSPQVSCHRMQVLKIQKSNCAKNFQRAKWRDSA